MTSGLERLEDGIVSLRVASDHEPYFASDLADRLSAAADELVREDSARVLVLKGGARYFSAGASRESLLASNASQVVSSYAARLPGLVLGLPLPSIAAMEGHAIGGGFMLGLWCDLAILAEESLYGANFMALGFMPGMGATILLEEALGPARGRDMLLSGRLAKGRMLRGAPGLHGVVPRGRVSEDALALAREIAEAPRRTLVLCKRALAARRLERLERALTDERAAQAESFSLPETRQRILDRYLEPAGGGEP